MTQPARRARQSTRERQETILAAALDLFGRRGFDAVGMRDVADACELSATGIYRHFPSKEALLVGLFDRLSDKIATTMRDASREGTPGLSLALMIRFHAALVVREPTMVPIYQGQQSALPPEERERFRRLLRSYLAMWTNALLELNPALAPGVARTTVVAAFGTMNGIAYHSSSLSPRALERLVAELAWRTLGQPQLAPATDAPDPARVGPVRPEKLRPNRTS